MRKHTEWTLRLTDKSGVYRCYATQIRVSTEGEFSIEIIDTKLASELGAEKGPYGKGNLTIRDFSIVYTGTELARLKSQIKEDIENLVEITETTDYILTFKFSSHSNYWKNGHGEIRPPVGHSREEGDQYFSGTERGMFGASRCFDIGIRASCLRRKKYTSGKGEKIEYTNRLTDSEVGYYAKQLNEFCIELVPSEHDQTIKVIPYTEDAARFFVDLIFGICHLTDQFNSYFSDAEKVTELIERRTKLLPAASDQEV